MCSRSPEEQLGMLPLRRKRGCTEEGMFEGRVGNSKQIEENSLQWECAEAQNGKW